MITYANFAYKIMTLKSDLLNVFHTLVF